MHEEIEAAALELFRQHGIKNISMDDIARRAGISKKTLYEQYATKDGLIAVVLNSVLRDCRMAVKLISIQKLHPVKVILKVYGLFVNQARVSHPIFLHSIRKYYPAFAQHYYQFREEILTGTLLPYFTKAMQSGILRQDINLHLLLDMHRKHFDDIIHGNPRTGRIDDHEALFQHVVVNNLRGLLTKDYYHLLDSKIELEKL